MVLGAQIASLFAAAVARDLVPPDKSIIRAATKQLIESFAHGWQDRKALDGPAPPYTPTPKPKPPPSFVTMYDAVNVDHIPASAAAVAGYVNGLYITTGELRARFPHARRLTIAVNIEADADCLDVETGDATPAQAPGWVRRQLGTGLKRPCVYANRSTMPAVWRELQAGGIRRNDVRLWVADWTDEPHIPTGYDACQWHGGPTAAYDESLCDPSFWA